MTPSATQVRGGRQKTWTRDKTIQALRRYAELYGDDFTAAAFSPSTAKWRDEPHLVERYYAGDPEGIGPWPSLNAIKTPFDGSFNAARVAAGLPPNKPGPSKRRRKSGEHKPIRDVSHVGATRVVFKEKTDEETLRRLERRAVKAEKKADRLAAEAERLRKRPKAKAVTKTKVKVVREKDLASLTAAKAQTKEARTAATRLAARLERAEATITSLRAEKAELKAEALRQSQRAAKALDRAEQLASQTSEVKEVEVVREVEKVVERVVELPSPEQKLIDEATRDAMLARRDAASATARAETSDRLYFELAQAVRGEQRRLTAGELAELRASGPAGPAVLAEAIKELAKARAGHGSMAAALTKVASAALTWKDRL